MTLAEGPRQADISDGQFRLWLLELERGGDGATNVPVTYTFRGALDVGALAEAIARLAARHEALRTRFHHTDAGIRQAVRPRSEVALTLRDLTGETYPHAVARRDTRTRLRTGIDVVNGDPFTADLYVLGPEEHLLLLTLNHLVVDGWSKLILCRDLGAFYTERAHGVPARLPVIEWQFLDYVRWHADRTQRGLAEPALDHWRETLAGARAPELRPVPPRAAGTPPPVGSLCFRVDSERADRLAELARTERVSPFVLHLALYYSVLHMVSGRRDLSVGSLLANRPRRELASTVGPFANALVLRAELADSAGATPVFRDWLAATRRTVLGMLPHQDVPYRALTSEPETAAGLRAGEIAFRMPASPGGVPHPDQVRFGDLETSCERTPDGMGARADLELLVAAGPRGLEGDFRYAADRYAPEYVRKLADTYVRLVDEVVADPAVPLRPIG